MPTVPWTPVQPTTEEVVVMASRFRVRKLSHVLPFFVDAMRVYAQTRRSDGAVGVSLVARPLRREFATLSAWRDRAALQRMVRTEPHRSVMVRRRAVMAESVFRFWNTSGSEPPTWDEADVKLAGRTSSW
ncbi:DUF3291 domain-containing protein [Actinomycetes bacterium KLBMP 9759]